MTNHDIETKISDIDTCPDKLAGVKPSPFRQYWNRGKPYIVMLILGVMIGALIFSVNWTGPDEVRPPQDTEFLRKTKEIAEAIPSGERQSLATAFDSAAARLENGDHRLLVDEEIRTAIAIQPTSGQWDEKIDGLIKIADSTDPKKFAENLRLIAEGLNNEKN